jgi:stearoyl-CoA desaturase (delta-9 desaturase)
MTKNAFAENSDATRPVPPATPMSIGTRLLMLGAVVLPFLGLIASIVLLWGWGLSWVELTLLAGMYLLTALGITVGYHRFFTHRSFETNPAVQCVLAVLGSMAVQGPLLMWVAVHRKHHQHSDDRDDPHSPHRHGTDFRGLVRGFWFAHVGWMFHAGPANLAYYVKDLYRSKLLRAVSALFPVWVVAGLLLPALLGWVRLGGWAGAVLGMVWAAWCASSSCTTSLGA